MSDTSAVGDLEVRPSLAEQFSQESDHGNFSKYLVPNDEILTRNLDHMRVWLRAQPHGTQSGSPHSIVTGRSSIQINGEDGQSAIFQVDSKLDETASEKINKAIRHGWDHKVSHDIGSNILDKSGYTYNRRVQTRFDKFEMYDFDMESLTSKKIGHKANDEDTGAPDSQVACVPVWNTVHVGTPSFVVR